MDDRSPALRIRMEVSAPAMKRIKSAAALKAVRLGDQAEARCTFHYWDTPGFQLHDEGLVLRTQREDDRTRLLLEDTRNGPTIEAFAPDDEPPFRALTAAGWKPRPRIARLADDVAQLFTAVLVCEERAVTWPDDTRARLAQERCVLTAPDRTSSERLALELELDSGDIRRLYELAYDLALQVPQLRLTSADATHWGYAFIAHLRPAPRRARELDLGPKASGPELAVNAHSEALAHIASNLDGAAESDDGEYIHQLRVGIRRLRVADRIAEVADLPTFSPRLEAQLRWASDILSEARDRDVFARQTWPALRDRPEFADVREDVERLAAEQRAAAMRAAHDALASARFQRVLLASAWIHTHQAADAGAVKGRRGARAVSRKLLARAERKVARRGHTIAQLTPEERHALRRDLKKLRYLAGFAAPLYARNAPKYLSRVAKLQSVLGKLNDLEVARALLQQHGGSSGDARRLVRESDAELHGETECDSDLARRWKRWRRARPFWT